MTVNNDIVLGVTRAADAAKREAAVSRLEKLSEQATGKVAKTAQTAEPASPWSTELQRAAANTSRPAQFVSTAGTTANAAKDASGHDKDVYVQFEAMLLKNMVESMMPEDAEAVFGKGTAGKIWKSMLAEKVAEEIARSGTIGIAKQVAAGEAASQAATKKAGDA